jgi:RNA polymerase-binding transcription factor DksA
MAKKPAKKVAKAAKPKAKVAPKKKVAAKAPVKKAAAKASKPKAKAKPIQKAAPKPAKKAAPKAAKPKAKAPIAKKAAPKAAKKAVAPKAVAKPAPKAVKPVAKPIAKPAVKSAPVKPVAKAPAPKKAAVAPVSKKPVNPPEVKSVAIVEVKEKTVSKKVAKTPVVKQSKRVMAPLPKLEPRRILKPPAPKPAIRINTDNRSRYTDAELAEFKELISGKLESSRSELKYLQEQISRSSEMGDDSDARFKGLEDGTSTSEREYLSQMASRQIQYIGHLEKAMIRIENKTYGICRETGKLISKERLRAVPHATLSIEAKTGKG